MTATARTHSFWKHYAVSLRLIFFVLAGALAGLALKERAAVLKPFGDIFLNLLFTAVVPFVFFSISSSIAGAQDLRRLGKIFIRMLAVFAATGVLAALIMLAAVKMYSPSLDISGLAAAGAPAAEGISAGQWVRAFTVPDFIQLLSKSNMLALIVFAALVGLAASKTGEKAEAFTRFLLSGNEVMLKVIQLIMFYAPLGLGAYFAYLTGLYGPQLLGSYARAVGLYYVIALLYFFLGLSFYAWIAGGKKGIALFWGNIFIPALTAFGTGSSIATIPANLAASDRIGVPKDISRVVIPLGATIHMDGSCLSAILKIAVLFGIFQRDFTGFPVLASAVFVALLSGVVMSGIPGGGFLGEILIVTLYGFPPEALPIISMIGTLVDPPATMVNSTGDTVCGMVLARWLNGKQWQQIE